MYKTSSSSFCGVNSTFLLSNSLCELLCTKWYILMGVIEVPYEIYRQYSHYNVLLR